MDDPHKPRSSRATPARGTPRTKDTGKASSPLSARRKTTVTTPGSGNDGGTTGTATATADPEDEKKKPTVATMVDKTHSYGREITLSFDPIHGGSLNREGRWELLQSIFPNIHEVSLMAGNVGFIVDGDLPPEPWPLSVGGYPATVGNKRGEGRFQIFPFCADRSGGGPEIMTDVNSHKMALSFKFTQELTIRIRDYFRDELGGIEVTDVIFACDGTLRIVVTGFGGIHTVPWTIAQRRAIYFRSGELDLPSLKGPDGESSSSSASAWAKRQVIPDPEQDIVDDSPYDVMRPGVCIRSREPDNPASWYTATSGVLVRDGQGDKYMTVAAHSVRMEVSQLVGKTGRHRVIGHKGHSLPYLDICLVRLDNGVRFENELSETDPGLPRRLTRLWGERNDDKDVDLMLKPVWMDTPSAGFMKAQIVGVHTVIKDQKTMSHMWTWAGQPEGAVQTRQPQPRDCGTPIWDADGAVLGFLQYHFREGPHAGISYSVHLDDFVQRGFRAGHL